MKIRSLISIACLGTACSLSALEPETPLPAVAGAAWFDSYYQNPRPQDFLMAVHSLSASGRLDDAAEVPTAIGFFATVFATHPQKVDTWLARTRDLPEAHRRILAAAAWKAGHTTGARLLREMASTADEGLREEIAGLTGGLPTTVADTPVRSASSLNLQWGAYLASGHEHHILAIVGALGSEEPGLSKSAVLTLARNAAAHPQVLAICQAEMERQPAAIRDMISTALAGEASRPGA